MSPKSVQVVDAFGMVTIGLQLNSPPRPGSEGVKGVVYIYDENCKLHPRWPYVLAVELELS